MHSSASILDLYIALSLSNFVLEVFLSVFALFMFFSGLLGLQIWFSSKLIEF